MASTTSNVARSLTTRINRKISDADTAAHGIMSRAFSTRKPQEKVVYRPEISLPIELLSATNPLAFTAPDIQPQSTPASASTGKFSFTPAQTLASTASSGSLRSDASVPGLSTSSSVTSPSPLQTPVNEVNEHDFSNEKRLTTLTEIESEASIAARLQESLIDEDKIAVEAPIVPKRAPSHTKKAHQGLHRQRSLSRIGARSPSAGPRSPSGSSLAENEGRKSSSSAQSNGHLSTHSLEKDANGVKVVRNSIDIFTSNTHADGSSKDHPFGAELAKLDEMAEEFSPTKSKHDEEVKEEPKKGLRRERSFKALRRGLSRKEKKAEPEPEPEPEAETTNSLQRQRSFKVLRRDPSTKELKPEEQDTMPILEKTLTPVEEHITVPAREPSRRRAPTVTRDEQPVHVPSTPRTPTYLPSPRGARPNKVAVPPSEPIIWDEESDYLNKHGLKMWSAEDYITEIGSPFASTFSSSQSGWL